MTLFYLRNQRQNEEAEIERLRKILKDQRHSSILTNSELSQISPRFENRKLVAQSVGAVSPLPSANNPFTRKVE